MDKQALLKEEALKYCSEDQLQKLQEAFQHDVQDENNSRIIEECFEEHAQMLEEAAMEEIINESILAEARVNPLANKKKLAANANVKAKTAVAAARKNGKRLKPRSGKPIKNAPTLQIGVKFKKGVKQMYAQPVADLGKGVKKAIFKANKKDAGREGIIFTKGRKPVSIKIKGRQYPIESVAKTGGDPVTKGGNTNKKASTKVTVRAIHDIMAEFVKKHPDKAKEFLEQAAKGGGMKVTQILKNPKVQDVTKKVVPALVKEPTPETPPPGMPPPENKREGFLSKVTGFVKDHPVGTGVALGLLTAVAAASGIGLVGIGPIVAKVAAGLAPALPHIKRGLAGGAVAAGSNLAATMARDASTGQKTSWKDRLKRAGKAGLAGFAAGTVGSLAGGALGSMLGGGNAAPNVNTAADDTPHAPEDDFEGDPSRSDYNPMEPGDPGYVDPNNPPEPEYDENQPAEPEAMPDRNPVDYSEVEPEKPVDPYSDEANPDFGGDSNTSTPVTGETPDQTPTAPADGGIGDDDESLGIDNSAATNASPEGSEGTPPGQNEPENAEDPYGEKDQAAAATPAAATPAADAPLSRDDVRTRMTNYAKNSLGMSDEDAKEYGDSQAAGMVEPEAPAPAQAQQNTGDEEDNTLDKQGHLRYQDQAGNYSTPGKGRVDTRGVRTEQATPLFTVDGKNPNIMKLRR